MQGCDDGRSWIANRSNDDSLRCFEPYDCDHDAGAGRGLTYGDGWFFATFGWGPPGGIERSRDGVTWETVLAGTTFGGVAYGAGRLLAASGAARFSDDAGATFADSGDTALTVSNVRRAAYLTGVDRFLMAASDQDDAEITVSDDASAWSLPSSIPASCGGGMQTEGGFAYGDGVIVAIGSDSVACRSSDGGETWQSSSVGGPVTSHLVWARNEFLIWGTGTVYRSADGVTWSSEPTTPANLHLGAVAVADSGTIVGVRGGWKQWYESQEFYRSTDGVQWDTLEASAFTGSHPIRFIEFGYGEPSGVCP